jgi:two-component SAPR family response regulator
MRVLVLEDELLLAMELQEILERLGNEVVGPVGRLSQARTLAETEELDGALLDMNLGTGTSFEIAETLAGRGVPFVFITGYEHKMLPASLNGARRLIKPLDERQLQEALEAFTSRD